MNVPSDTRTLLEMLEELYPDKYEVDKYDTPEYWKKAGVIELLRKIRDSVGSTKLNSIDARK